MYIAVLMKRKIHIIGGGAAGLALAAHIDSSVFDVSIYEKNKSFGRKFLVAGKGGFNLTHSEPIEDLIRRYTPNNFLNTALSDFHNVAFRKWLDLIGIPTFVGSSKRVYPEPGIKPIEVLNKIIQVIENRGVTVHFNHHWIGWNSEKQLTFENGNKIDSGIFVFALGGGSWKVTGSDGKWLKHFKNQGIKSIPFSASNCAFEVNWGKAILDQYEGNPLKNIAISCANKRQVGEVVLTHFGFEGNAIYALSPEIRNELEKIGKATIFIDFKPSLSLEDLHFKLKESKLNIGETLKKKLKLSPVMIGLLKSVLDKKDYTNPQKLAEFIKSFPVELIGISPIDEAISTVGGIALKEIDENYQFKKLQNHYCIGEMLDWDAPTGGYLLQGCFSMGVHLANHLNPKEN